LDALPEGLYLIEWRAAGKRRRASAGVTVAQALEAQRRKRHELEGRSLGIPGFGTAGEEPKKPALHVAVRKYLTEVETLRKPNTHRKYECVLERFLEFFKDHQTIDQINSDDLTCYIIALKKDHSLGANTILHNAVIVAQFLKRLGRPGVTKGLQLPEPITPLPREYRESDLAKFFKAAYDAEKVLYSTFLLSGFREMEVVHLYWSDINFDLQTARVTSKPELGFYPKRWEEREVPIPVKLIELLKTRRPRPGCKLAFPSPTGNREYHMLGVFGRVLGPFQDMLQANLVLRWVTIDADGELGNRAWARPTHLVLAEADDGNRDGFIEALERLRRHHGEYLQNQ
jgi:integrase